MRLRPEQHLVVVASWVAAAAAVAKDDHARRPVPAARAHKRAHLAEAIVLQGRRRCGAQRARRQKGSICWRWHGTNMYW